MSTGFMADSFCAVPGVKEKLKRKMWAGLEESDQREN